MQINIDTTSIKGFLLSILELLNTIYLFLNQELLFAWRRILDKQSDNVYTRFFRIMLDKPATALFINTILFYILSGIISGHSGLIGAILSWLAFLNIIVFLINILRS